MTPKWHALIVGEDFNSRVRDAAKEASGAYAVRDRASHEVKYVGESSRGSLWKTLLRHFQAPESFRKVREGFVSRSPERYEVALHVTSRGARPRESSQRGKDLRKKGKRVRTDADQAASRAQAAWIASLRPTHNKDDGTADAVAQELRATRARQEAEDRDAGAFGGLLNPSSPLTEIGLLTRLSYGSRVLRWSLRDAPSLAYDDAGRLFVVYRGRVVRSSTPAEIKKYAASHWGQRGAGKVRDGGLAVGPFTRLGTSKSITYTTKKGSDPLLVDYVHPWGEGAPSKGFVAPFVVEHECTGGCGPRCAARGAIALHGGSYRVTDRGIVG